MDKARAVINLKEGVIELEGPVDFVRSHLSRYQAAMKELRGLTGDVAPESKKEKTLPRKRKGAGLRPRKGERGSPKAVIGGYVKAGFFDEPRSIGDVRRRLNEEGLTFSDNATRASFKNLIAAGSLERLGRSRAMRYRRPAQP